MGVPHTGGGEFFAVGVQILVTDNTQSLRFPTFPILLLPIFQKFSPALGFIFLSENLDE